MEKYAATNIAMPALQRPLFRDDDTKWQAVQSRDPGADGFFVYGVRTTKVFCRPTCKARLARRANVRFYATGDEAKKNGFRACKRCKPEVLGLMPEEEAVQKIRAFVREHQPAAGADAGVFGETQMSLSQMAKKTGLSKWHFHRVFKKCVGVTPVEYLKRLRDDSAGSSPEYENDGGLNWTEQLDLTGLDMDFDFDFGFLNDPLLVVEQSTQSSSTTASTSECSPFTFDDLLVWPESNSTE
jgi:methylphosphotriester-DNA--protein-cysteine methyltransferase